jgi:uncharacterized membrane protein
MMTDAELLGIIHAVTRVVEVIGVLVILGGAFMSGVLYVRDFWREGTATAYRCVRSNLGRSILLGLELLVAADIINTVAIKPTLESVAVLAAIVLVRTFLSFALEAEIEGRWPWQQKEGRAAATRTGEPDI